MKAALLFVLVALAGCSADRTTAPRGNVQPQHVEVQHVLVGFEGTVPGKAITRSQAEAESLAAVVLARANAGEDFAGLVEQYTDDQYPGIYFLANTGVPADLQLPEYPRGTMVKAFGDVAFSLPVGAVGLATYDAQASPFGFHVIKRLE
jgi:hypothetical protein